MSFIKIENFLINLSTVLCISYDGEFEIRIIFNNRDSEIRLHVAEASEIFSQLSEKIGSKFMLVPESLKYPEDLVIDFYKKKHTTEYVADSRECE